SAVESSLRSTQNLYSGEVVRIDVRDECAAHEISGRSEGHIIDRNARSWGAVSGADAADRVVLKTAEARLKAQARYARVVVFRQRLVVLRECIDIDYGARNRDVLHPLRALLCCDNHLLQLDRLPLRDPLLIRARYGRSLARTSLRRLSHAKPAGRASLPLLAL